MNFTTFSSTVIIKREKKNITLDKKLRYSIYITYLLVLYWEPAGPMQNEKIRINRASLESWNDGMENIIRQVATFQHSRPFYLSFFRFTSHSVYGNFN